MMNPPISPALAVAVPLLGAAALTGARKWLARAVMDALGLLISLATLFICAWLLLGSVHHGASVYWLGGWWPRGSTAVGIGLVIEPIGTGLATFAALLTTLALLFSWRFVETGSNHFQPLMLIFLAAMSGFSLTGDLFNLFVFFELMSIAAFALCGLKTAEPAPLQGSFNFAITNSVAGFVVLTGIALLYSATGALNMAQIGLSLGTRHDPLVLFAWTLLTCGFLVKAAIVPFHLWLPDAHAVAPTPVCVLFSGLMVELGLYAVARIHYAIFAGCFASHHGALHMILYSFAAATVLLGGVMCYAEHHLKRMLAFSTICHSGLMLATLAAGGPLALAAMLAYLLAHGLVKGGLFFLSGVLLHNRRSITEPELFAAGRKLPWAGTLGALWILGGIGLAAAPPLALLLGEAGAEHAAELTHLHGLSLLFIFGGGMTAAAVLRVGMHTFFGWGGGVISDRAAEIGELPETKPENRKIHPYHIIAPAFCILFAIAIAFLPGWLHVLRDAAAAMANQPAYLHTTYTGQNVPLTQPSWREAIPGAAGRGLLALGLGTLLALSSVFRNRLPRPLRAGAFMEHGFRPLRAMQSGHPGDYVLWITVGLALFGSAAMIFMRA
ncbi:MAG TPA: complex I subunit 5 family protein [Acidobacteriaceae bacterium]|jgi:multicomponent Na+:H+ antiporter subunit D|nr:complex I subunit 5 family protein [Acidobacteriaceae bacterium]